MPEWTNANMPVWLFHVVQVLCVLMLVGFVGEFIKLLSTPRERQMEYNQSKATLGKLGGICFLALLAIMTFPEWWTWLLYHV